MKFKIMQIHDQHKPASTNTGSGLRLQYCPQSPLRQHPLSIRELIYLETNYWFC